MVYFGDFEVKTKECTPDSADATAAACCDDQGMFATTSVQCTMASGDRGYCNAGVCSTFKCRINLTLRTGEKVHLDTFCGVSESNSCSAMCESSATNTCYDPVDTWLEVESLADGAYCEASDFRGRCVSGECKRSIDPMLLPIDRTTEMTTVTTFSHFEYPPVPEKLPPHISFNEMQDYDGADNKVKLLQFLLGLAFVFYQVE